MKTNLFKWLIALGLSLGASGGLAGTVSVNGYVLSPQELSAPQYPLGMQGSPGAYWVDPDSGCWRNLTTGAAGCVGANGGGMRASPSGSGEWDGNGNWSSYSDYTGGSGVGGTSDGCIYADGWSNC